MFTLDPRIDRDSILIAKLELCQLRLQNDQRFPWLILIPEVEGVTEVHELDNIVSMKLLSESNVIAAALAKVTQCKKVNVANLGNVVSQLHWHVVARFETDEAWPAPMWGVGVSVPWEQKKRLTFVESLFNELQVNNVNFVPV